MSPFFLSRGSKKKKYFGEGYAFLNHGGVESPGIKKSHFLNFISRNFMHAIPTSSTLNTSVMNVDNAVIILLIVVLVVLGFNQ